MERPTWGAAAPDAGRVRALSFGVLVLCAAVMLGCSHHRPLPDPTNRTPAYALQDPSDTRLHRLAGRAAENTSGRSGFSLIESGPQAFASIRNLIAAADRTLDLQYYIWKNDESGGTLLADLLDAAARGVRVRLLLDDLEAAWPDHQLARLNALPNFEIRLFNPISRDNGKLLDSVLNFDRVTNRMHNKLFIADNTVAIMGGRNVGDQYFASDDIANFRDLDIHAVGPIVRELSASFDSFWNSNWCLSVATLNGQNGQAEGEGKAPLRHPSVADLKRRLGLTDRRPDTAPMEPEAYLTLLFEGLVWTKGAFVVADVPNKPETDRSKLVEELVGKIPVAQNELLLESAYFVPGRQGVEALCMRVAEGVRVRILTNSYSSIDAFTAYVGYRKYREDLLACGVDLHELHPESDAARRKWQLAGSKSLSILHTKAAVIDRRYLFVGSVNYDPRSTYLNTEIAVLIDSPAIAGDAARFVLDGLSPENSWALALKDGEIVWTGADKGSVKHRTDEPGIGLWGHITSWFVGLLPIEDQI